MALFRIGVIERYERSFTVEATDEAHALEIVSVQACVDEGEFFEYHSTTGRGDWNVTPIEEPDTTEADIEASKHQSLTYAAFVQEAADLVSEHGENPEYDRSLYELGARLFGVVDMDTSDRASYIEADVRKIKPVHGKG